MPTLANIHGASTVAQHNPQLMGLLQNVNQLQNSALNRQLLGEQIAASQANRQLAGQQYADQREQAEQAQQFAALSGQVLNQAYSSGDYGQSMADMIASDPSKAPKVFEVLGAITQQQKDEMATFAYELANTPYEQRSAKIMARVSQLEAQGRDPQHTLALLNDTSEQQDDALQTIQMAALTPLERVQETSKQAKNEADLTMEQDKLVSDTYISQVKLEVDATKESFKMAEKLRGEIYKAGTDRDKIKASYGRIQSLDDSAAGDLALIFNFMKMLDPGSVVRESEFATAAAAASIPERIKGAWERVVSGERLTHPQRKDFLRQSSNIYKRTESDYEKVINKFVNIGKGYGVKREQLLGPETEAQQEKQSSIDNLTLEEALAIKAQIGAQ